MKIHNKLTRKIIISSLALLSGTALVGSVTGTVAWFQYVTRAQVAFTGTTAHCSKMLQISVDDGDDNLTNNVWGTDIKSSQLPDPAFPPVTSGPLAKDAPLEIKERTIPGQFEDEEHTIPKKISSPFYADPNIRQGLYENWVLASDNSYSQFTILVRVKDVDENYKTNNPTYLKNDVYLTDLTIQDAGNGVTNLSDAIRVHFAIESPGKQPTYMLFAKEATSTNVGGFLDMNNDGKFDTFGYEFDYSPCLYGGSDGEPDYDEITETVGEEEVFVDYTQIRNPLVQTSYASDDDEIIATEDNMGNITGGTPLGQTSATAGEFLKITVTMWLEGWCDSLIGMSGSSSSSIWNTDEYIQKSFNVGMTFGVQLHSSDE